MRFFDEFWYYYYLWYIFPKTCLSSSYKFLWTKSKHVCLWAVIFTYPYFISINIHTLYKVVFRVWGVILCLVGSKLYIKLITVDAAFSPVRLRSLFLGHQNGRTDEQLENFQRESSKACRGSVDQTERGIVTTLKCLSYKSTTAVMKLFFYEVVLWFALFLAL